MKTARELLIPLMNKSRSIKQNGNPPNRSSSRESHDALPDFRNLGVTLRILLIGSGFALLQVILLANTWDELPLRLLEIATLLVPIMLASLLLLWAAQPWLSQLEYWQGALGVAVLVTALTIAINFIGSLLFHPASGGY